MLTWTGHTYNHSKWENDGVQYVQEAAYSSFCVPGAQATRHSKRVTKGEAEVFASQCLQVLLRNWFDREKSRIGKTIESNGRDQADHRRSNEG